VKREKKKVDEMLQTLHTLPSSLTNKTLRSMQYKIFKN